MLSEVSKRSAAVSFVDYGDCQIVPISNIRKLPRSLQNIPFMAVPCKLAAVQLDCWPQKSIDIMKNICKRDTLCKAVFHPQTTNEVSMEFESLFVGDTNVSELVFQHSFCQPFNYLFPVPYITIWTWNWVACFNPCKNDHRGLNLAGTKFYYYKPSSIQ